MIDQMKNYIFNHYNKCLQSSKYRDSRDIILEEILEENKEEKLNLLKMIQDNSIEKDLKKEFVDSELMTEKEFLKEYKNIIDSYCGF